MGGDRKDKKSRVEYKKAKEIIELYFSYGKEMIRLEGDNSRHSSDLNLHINTSGYEDGEQMEIELRTPTESFVINATIRDNQAFIKEIFKDKKYQ